jgi:acyl-ACP thioesterase
VAPDLAPPPTSGRTFTAGRRVRLGDATPGGRLRLDALARYLQDVSSDDTADAGVDDDGTWIVRRTVVAVGCWPVFSERFDLTTWCSGIGSRWAERRVSLRGDRGGAVETATLWVHVDADGLPALLPPAFAAVYAEAAGGREVSSRLSHPKPPPGSPERPWPLRAVDLDVLRHVNNAAYWAVVEEELAAAGRDLTAPFVAEMEHRSAMLGGDDVSVTVAEGDGGRFLLWVLVDGRVRASARVTPGGQTSS